MSTLLNRSPSHTGPLRLVPLRAGPHAETFACCLACREPGEDPWIVLAEEAHATAYLGALVDGEQRVLAWLEIWVQMFGELHPEALETIAPLDNRQRDRSWDGWVAVHRHPGSERWVATGWETEPFPPWRYDPDEAAYMPCATAGIPWEVCRDDAVLREHDQPPYADTADRCVKLCDEAGNLQFRALPLEPTPDEVLPLFNTWGGRLLVRRWDPWRVEHFRQAALGRAVDIPVTPVSEGEESADWMSNPRHPDRWLTRGEGQVNLESLVVRLRLLARVYETMSAIRQRGLPPFLNLSPSSFGFRFGEVEAGVPPCWTPEVYLATPGASLPLVPGEDCRWWWPSQPPRLGVYHRDVDRTVREGESQLRLREVHRNVDPPVVIGTLAEAAAWHLRGDELLQIRLTISQQPLVFLAQLDPQCQDERDAGWTRFWALPETIPEAFWDRAGDGTGFATVPAFVRVFPQWGAVDDFYSLGILAVQLFLAEDESVLAPIVDDLFEVAAATGADPEEQRPLRDAVAACLGSTAAGRARLPLTRVFESEIPTPHWDQARIEILTLLLQLIPGACSESFLATSGGPGGRDAMGFEAAAEIRRVERLLRAALLSSLDQHGEIQSILSEVARSLDPE